MTTSHESPPPGPDTVAGSGSAPSATAAVVLLANAATAAADTPAGSGEWAYTSSVIVMNGTGTHVLRMQIWEKTDPTALRDEIYRQAQNEIRPTGQQLYTVDQWAFQLIGHLVRNAAPPALKAALYRVAATIPDVEYVNDVTDAAGRHGIGVAHTVNNAGDRTILIFDRTTFQVMGSAVEAQDGIKDSAAVLATGLVANAGQTP